MKLLPYIVTAAFVAAPPVAALAWAQDTTMVLTQEKSSSRVFGVTIIGAPKLETLELVYNAGVDWIEDASKSATVRVKKMCMARRQAGGWSVTVSYDCDVGSCPSSPRRNDSDESTKNERQALPPKRTPHPPPRMPPPAGQVDVTTILHSERWATRELAYKAGKAWVDDPKHDIMRMENMCLDQRPNGRWQASISYVHSP